MTERYEFDSPPLPGTHRRPGGPRIQAMSILPPVPVGIRPWQAGTIYQILVDKWKDGNGDGVGDLTGLLWSLDYLAELGVTDLWLNPICESPRRDAGFDISDYERIDPLFGTMDLLARVCDEAGQRNMRVIAELVLGHTSDQHPWFLASSDPRHRDHEHYRDWYHWSPKDGPNPWRHTPLIFPGTVPTNRTYSAQRDACFGHTFNPFQPDLNYANPEVVTEHVRLLRLWFDIGVKLIREDAASHLWKEPFWSDLAIGQVNINHPLNYELWRNICEQVRSKHPDCGLLGEFNANPEQVQEYLAIGFAAGFDLYRQGPILDIWTRGRAAPLAAYVERLSGLELPPGAATVGVVGIHDERTLQQQPRQRSERVMAAVGPENRFNWGTAGRLQDVTQGDEQAIKFIVMLDRALPGPNVLYYGDEFGMSSAATVDPLPQEPGIDLRRRQRPVMSWAPIPGAGFSAQPESRFWTPTAANYLGHNVHDSITDSHSLLIWNRNLNVLKREFADLFDYGGLTPLATWWDPEVVFWLRFAPAAAGGTDRLLVVANASIRPKHIQPRLGKRFPPVGQGRQRRYYTLTRIDTLLDSREMGEPCRILARGGFPLDIDPLTVQYWLLDEPR